MIRRSALLGVASLVAAAAASVWTAEVETASRVRAALIGSLAGTSGTVEVGGVSVDALTGALHLRDLSVRRGTTRLTVGAVDLAPGHCGLGFAAAAEAAPASPAANGRASADNVVLSSGTTTYRIPHVELSGTNLADADVARLLEPKSADTFEARLRQLTAASVVVPAIDVDDLRGTDEQHWRQTQILLTDVVAGKAATASAGPSSLASKTATGVSNVQIDALQGIGLDMGQVAHVLEATRSGEEPLLSLFDSLVASKVTFTDVTHDRTSTIAAVKETGLKARAFEPSLGAQAATLSSSRPGDPASAAFLNDLLQSVSLQAVEFDDWATLPSASGHASASAFRLKHAVLHDFGGGRRIGGFEAAGVDYLSGENRVLVDSVRASGLTFPQPAKSGAAPTGGTPNDVRNIAPVLDGFEMTGAEIESTFSPDGATDRRTAFKLGHAIYAAPGSTQGRVPQKATFSLDHLSMVASPDEGTTRTLYAMGYRQLDFSGKLNSAYDESKQAFSLGDLTTTGAGMGTARLKLDLANVGEGVASADAAIQKASAIAILFKDADLLLLNDGLVDKAIAYKAELDGLTVAAERDALTSLVTSQFPMLIGDPPKLHPLEAALAKFLAQPKSLHLSVESPKGVGVADFANLDSPLGLLDLLEIKAAANE